MKKEKQNNDNPDLKIPGRLKTDLNALFKSDEAIPPEIDRAILDKARKSLTHPAKRYRIFHWVKIASAAAAVIIFACLLVNQNEPVTKINAYTEISRDIDNNGRVDILDAFKLAKQIQSAGITDKKWDMNGDGLVNRDDVDEVALVAVSLNKGAY